MVRGFHYQGQVEHDLPGNEKPLTKASNHLMVKGLKELHSGIYLSILYSYNSALVNYVAIC